MVFNILLWALFGLIAGAVAQFIMPGKDPGQSADPRGILITIGLGIAGAMLGGFLGSNLFGWDITGFNLSSLGIAIAGGLLLLILYRMVMSARTAHS